MRIIATHFAISFICFEAASVLAQHNVEESKLWQDLQTQSPWVFLGDSNTYSGGYIAVLDAWMTESPNRPKLLNLGMSSETAAGTSEVDHPFKRPCIHERLSKVLSMVDPAVVFICYGMNDGIYQPPSEANFQKYREGMLKLAAQIRASGAKLVCLTPPLFEPGPVKARGKLGPSKEGRYAYFAPAADYDRVLEKQAQWCLKNELKADLVIDIRSSLRTEKAKLLESDPKFSYSKDGVHFGMVAHGVVAEKILVTLGAPATLVGAYPKDAAIQLSDEKLKILRDAYLSATGKNRPKLPAGDPIWLAELKASRIGVKTKSAQ